MLRYFNNYRLSISIYHAYRTSTIMDSIFDEGRMFREGEVEVLMEALEFFSYTASAEEVRQILVQKYGDLVPPMPDLVRWLYEMKEVVIGMMEKADSIDWDEEIKRKRRLRINKIKDFCASYEEENK